MKTKLFRSFVILIIALGGFFIFGKNSLATTADHLVISEVQISGATVDDEFVEIYNPTNLSVNITGWRLSRKTASGTQSNLVMSFSSISISAHSYLLVISPEYNATSHNGITGDVIYSTTQHLATDNSILLYSDAGITIVDKVGLGTATDKETSSIANPPTNGSVERKASEYSTLATLSVDGIEEHSGNSYDSEDNSNDFVTQSISNPQNSYSPTEDSPPLTAPLPSGPVCGNAICEDGEDYLSCPADCAASPPLTEINPGDVVINEFVSDPAEGGEWIEIFNKKNFEINLTGWKLEDGAGTIATLDTTITANGFQTIELSSSKLNNSGDIIKLKTSDGTIIDQVAYGNWDDGNISDNAPKASDPNSVARKIDGDDTDNDLADFSETTTLTKNSANTITAPPSEETGGVSTPEETTPSAPPSWPVGSLLINEFVADPADNEVEWIEIFNPGNALINLTGWTLEDGGETVTTLSGSVGPLGFFCFRETKRNFK
ncbi:MAG: lamin tail domain-containing protein [Patescibacteria group bacterium]